MRFSGASTKTKLHFSLHLALIAAIALSIVSSSSKCVAQSAQQIQQRLREEMERQREQQQERQAEREREQQQRQQEAEREREQQREQELQAERQREQEERQQAERQREQQEQRQQIERARQQQEQQQQLERERQQQLQRQMVNDSRPQPQFLPNTQPVNRPVQRPVFEKPDLRFRPDPIRVPILPNPVPVRPPIVIEPQPVFVTRPPLITPLPAISIVLPGASQASVVMQEILSTQAAETQAITNGIDQIVLALIQNSSNTELAKAMLNQMSQPDPMQQALKEQLQGFSDISQADANRACSAACANNPDVQRLTAQCNSGSQASCYQAAASLCQCSISNGGCGSDINQLQACVQQNNQSANSLVTAPATLNLGQPSSGSQSGVPAGNQNSGTSSSNCSSNWSACPAD